MHVHSTLESVYAEVPMEMLPEEYLPDDYTGPSAGSLKKITGVCVVVGGGGWEGRFLATSRLPVLAPLRK